MESDVAFCVFFVLRDGVEHLEENVFGSKQSEYLCKQIFWNIPREPFYNSFLVFLPPLSSSKLLSEMNWWRLFGASKRETIQQLQTFQNKDNNNILLLLIWENATPEGCQKVGNVLDAVRSLPSPAVLLTINIYSPLVSRWPSQHYPKRRSLRRMFILCHFSIFTPRGETGRCCLVYHRYIYLMTWKHLNGDIVRMIATLWALPAPGTRLSQSIHYHYHTLLSLSRVNKTKQCSYLATRLLTANI